MADGAPADLANQPGGGADPAPVLEVRGLSKAFGAVIASDDVTLDVCTGEIHALIGPNGAGKSTLIKQIAGEMAPDRGSVLFRGTPVDGLSTPERTRLFLGRTFQVSTLALELTVLQNVLLAVVGRTRATFTFFRRAGTHAERTAAAHAALERVGIAALAHRPAGVLAHGQRRLLEIAIALALAPKVLLLDEPMAGLGDAGSKELTVLLDQLRHEVPILLVEHDMDAVFALADRISVLVSGRVIATGSVDAIRSSPAVRAAYLGGDGP